jgi:hypothetical protein
MADRRPRDPAQRLDQAVLAQGIQNQYWPDADVAQFAGHHNLTWWISHLREAETRHLAMAHPLRPHLHHHAYRVPDLAAEGDSWRRTGHGRAGRFRPHPGPPAS